MNNLTKSITSAASIVTLVMLAGCSVSPSVSASLPRLTQVTAHASQQIANDLDYEMAAAKQLPHAVRNIRSASVEVSELAGFMVVEAGRLPAAEHLAEVTTAQNTPF